MPSTELTKAPRLLDLGLDLENDQSDWYLKFPAESALPADSAFPEESRREGKSLFTLVEHSRTTPIVLPSVSEAAEARPIPVRRQRSVLRRVKRVFSPATAALIVLYVVVVAMTAWIGLARGTAARNVDLTSQASTPEPAFSSAPANLP